jgi:hypothetical protein
MKFKLGVNNMATIKLRMAKQEYETETSKWVVNCIQWEDQNKPIAIQTKKGFKFVTLKEEI